MRAQAILASLVLWLVLPLAVSADTIVLRDGRRLESQGPYTIAGGKLTFTGTDGERHEFALQEVNLLATRAANTRPSRSKVWTNDDLESLRGRAAVNILGARTPPPSASGEKASAEAAAAAGGKPEAAPPKEETREYWQERAQKIRAQLTKVEQELETLRSDQGQARSNAVSVIVASPGVNVADRIQMLEQKRADLNRQMEDLRTEARRQGVPPGWVR